MGKFIFGDCLRALKEMPDESLDAVITDPPYCSGGFTEAGKKAAKGQGLRTETIDEIGWFENDNMSTAGLIWLLRECMVEIERLLKPGCSALVFTDWRMVPHLAPALESSGMQYRNMLVWDKGSAGLGNGFKPTHEIILHFVKGSAVFHSLSGSNVVRSKRVHHGDKIHQTEKPVDLLAQLLKVVTKEGDTVLDPFHGSGSLAEACLKLNRGFIGIEKSKVYHQKAKERYYGVQAEIQNSLFNLPENA